MKAMALAAGKGTRLFPLTGEIPKPMAPVVNTPIIEHIFDLLAGHDIEEVYVNVYYLADQLLAAYDEETHLNGMRVRLSREEELQAHSSRVAMVARAVGRALPEVERTHQLIAADKNRSRTRGAEYVGNPTEGATRPVRRAVGG